MNRPAPDYTAALVELKQQVCAAEHKQVTPLIDGFRAQYGGARSTIWLHLKKHAGYKSNRKKRVDAGKTQLPDETLDFIAASKNVGVRANGIATKPTCVAMNIAVNNGMEVNVSKSRVDQLLRARKLDTKTQAKARTHQRMRSLYPNHVHQIDPSLCLLFYLNGEQVAMSEEKFNRNKPANMEAVKLKVWRYVRYDHASGSIDVKYYESAGENQLNMFDFMIHTWGEQEFRLSHGVPEKMLWDKGSANTSASVQRFLDALGVDHETHATGHSWSKGAVEQANRVVEQRFESRLREDPVTSVDELNDAAYRWVRDFNADCLDQEDCRLRRKGVEPMNRDDLWHLITAEQLRAMPDRKTCQYFMHGRQETRVLSGAMQISYRHPQAKRSLEYDLSAFKEHLAVKDKITVSPLLTGGFAIRAEIERLSQEPLVMEVQPIHEYDQFGFEVGATVFGDYHQSKPSAAELAAEKIAQAAWGEDVSHEEGKDKLRKNERPFQHMNDGKGMAAHSYLGDKDLPERLPRQSQSIETPEVSRAKRAVFQEQPMSYIEAAKRLRTHPVFNYTPDTLSQLKKRFPEGGVTEDQLDQFVRAPRSLSAVEGGAQ